MAEKLGVMVVTSGSRGASMIDTLYRSKDYRPALFIADKYANPHNMAIAEESGGIHQVVDGLAVEGISQFAKEHEKDIEFGIVGPEGPIIDGVKDVIEGNTRIKMLCPSKEYAIEGSKAEQRILISKEVPGANPDYKIFCTGEQLKGLESEFIQRYRSTNKAINDFRLFYEELGGECVIKPDTATSGKGVVVSEDHFSTLPEAEGYFRDILKGCAVVVEEKLIGEESSFQGFSDGNKLVPVPYVRDYKRLLRGDEGRNTGGMGSHMDNQKILSFMKKEEGAEGYSHAQRFFKALKGPGYNPDMLFVPTYLALMHTPKTKILECNSRPGDPEIMNILAVMEDDFVGLCDSMLNGKLPPELTFKKKATVVTYKVPPDYGGRPNDYEGDTEVDLSKANALRDMLGDDRIRIYPGSMEMRDDKYHSSSSRTVAVVGIEDNTEKARKTSVKVIKLIKGGGLWYRTDIASQDYIDKSVENMRRVREMAV